jgi:hypothetical protein
MQRLLALGHTYLTSTANGIFNSPRQIGFHVAKFYIYLQVINCSKCREATEFKVFVLEYFISLLNPTDLIQSYQILPQNSNY